MNWLKLILKSNLIKIFYLNFCLNAHCKLIKEALIRSMYKHF